MKKTYFVFLFFLFSQVFSQDPGSDLILEFSQGDGWIIAKREASVMQIDGEEVIERPIIRRAPEVSELLGIYSKADFDIALGKGEYHQFGTRYLSSYTPPFIKVLSWDHKLMYAYDEARFFSQGKYSRTFDSTVWTLYALLVLFFFLGILQFSREKINIPHFAFSLILMFLYFLLVLVIGIKQGQLGVLSYTSMAIFYSVGACIGRIILAVRKQMNVVTA